MPADFRVPRGWPTPTDKWVRDNAFWRPPVGWTPVPNSAVAPADWQFWVPNKLWSQTMGNHFRSIAIWSRLSNWCALLWMVALVASPILGYPPPLRIVGLSAAAAATAFLVVHEVLKARTSTQLMTHFATVAERGRQERLRREYQRYLTAVA